MSVRRLILLLGIAVITLAGARPAFSQEDEGHEILRYLGRNIDWYHSVGGVDQNADTAQDVVFRDTLNGNAYQCVDLGFQYANSRADFLMGQPGNSATSATSPTTQAKLAQAAVTAAQRITNLQQLIGVVNNDIKTATPETLPLMQARRDELTSELNLATQRQTVITNYLKFSSGGNGTLKEQIDDLHGSLPDKNAAAPKPSDNDQYFHVESAGIFGLGTEMFNLSRRMSQLGELSDQTQKLIDDNTKLREPLHTELSDLMKHGDSLTATRPQDLNKLNDERVQVDALAARYKQLTDAMIPLAEQNLKLQATKVGIEQWHSAVERMYRRVIEYLLIRLASMGIAIIICLGISELWRKATFRYVSDVRRRRQFLVVRRIVVGAIIIIILIAGIVTEFGSLATFAGLITAGIAVALQSVILSGFAYFFFIGRYGVRVGDRVTVSGITGDVIDIGLFRIYLAELGGSSRDLHPTGRIVVFSNSVLFQSNAFFKQLPGADYTWHEVALTLEPKSDLKLVETTLVGAVNEVYESYRTEIETQQASVNASFHLEQPAPKPEGRVRFVDSGVEFVVRYPVRIHDAAETDDLVTRKLLETIAAEPKLQLCSSGTPKIQAAQ